MNHLEITRTLKKIIGGWGRGEGGFTCPCAGPSPLEKTNEKKEVFVESKQFRASEDPIHASGTMKTVEIVVTLDHCEQ